MRTQGFLFVSLAACFFCLTSDSLADWGTAQRLTWTADGSIDPAVATGPGNAVHAVWSDYTPGNPEIYYKRSTDGGVSWGAARRLIWNAGDSFAPAMAADASNAVHLVWSDNTPGNYEIYYKRSTDGGVSWGAAQRLTWTSGDSVSPAATTDASNRIHLVWQDGTPGNNELYYKRSTDGGTAWSAAQRLTWTSGGSITPALDIGVDNTVHVVWVDDTPGNPEVHYKGGTNEGLNWSAPQRLTWTSSKTYTPAIAIDSNNALHVTWEDDTPGNYEIHYKKGANGGATWSAAQRLTWTSLESLSTAVAVGSSGPVHVVWSDYTPGNPEVCTKSSSDGGTTWTPVQRLTWTLEDSSSPALAIDAGGILHVVWSDFTPGNYEIYYKKGN